MSAYYKVIDNLGEQIMKRKGISPVIATVIIVAVAIAISIAVAGWLFGLWGSFGATEQLTVMPDSTLSGSTLVVHIKNTGSKSAVITKIEVSGLDTVSSGDSVTVGTTATTLPVTLTQGADSYITATLGTSATAGTQYLVKIYTDSGGVYQGYVVAG